MENMEKQYVEKSIDFVWSETLKLIRKNPSLKEIQNDLISAGIEGLVVASKRFKPEKGFSFLTYAGHWVKQKMMEEIRINSSPLTITKKGMENLYRLKKNKQVKEKESLNLMNAKSRISLDYENEENNLPLLETIGSNQMEKFQEKMEKREMKEELKKVMKRVLTEEEFKVICLRYGLFGNEPKNYREISEEMGWKSRQVAHQKEKRAMKKLIHAVRKNKKLREFIR